MSCTPGPCYDIEGACQSQSSSGKMSPPQWMFGTAERFSGSPRKRTPGPGAYNNAGSFGTQRLSNRSTFPIYGFGSVDRTMASKVPPFVSVGRATFFLVLRAQCPHIHETTASPRC